MAKFRFANATKPPALAQPRLFWVPIAAGVVATGLVLAQLSTFEAFSQAVSSYGLFGGQGPVVFALCVAALEILAVPALFRLFLSPAMRYVSTGAIAAAPLLWLALIGYAFTSGLPLGNTGLFGGLVALPANIYAVLLASLFLFLATFAVIVLGPSQPRRHT